MSTERVPALPGQRVELVHCDDPFTELRPGDRGAAGGYTPLGGLDVTWDSGSTLSMLPDQGDVVWVVEG